VIGLPPLAALPTAPACARGHVRAVACEWGLPELADTAELLASELVTNGVQASERLRIRSDMAIMPVVRLWLVSTSLSRPLGAWGRYGDLRASAIPGYSPSRATMLRLSQSLYVYGLTQMALDTDTRPGP
jgi:hypothetical protein